MIDANPHAYVVHNSSQRIYRSGSLQNIHADALAKVVCDDFSGHRTLSPGTATMGNSKAAEHLSKRLLRPQSISKPRVARVAFDEQNRPKGFATLEPLNQHVRTYAIYVAPELRGSGVAEELTREALTKAFADSRLHRVDSCYAHGNNASAKLHKNLGFAEPKISQHWKLRLYILSARKTLGIHYHRVTLDRAAWEKQTALMQGANRD